MTSTHRFNVGEPYDELTQLAATFDDMLARLASSLRHEQLLSAELSHELRTPLAAIATEAELALRRERGAEEYRRGSESDCVEGVPDAGTLETLMAAAGPSRLKTWGTAAARPSARGRSLPATAWRATAAIGHASQRARRFDEGRHRRRHG